MCGSWLLGQTAQAWMAGHATHVPVSFPSGISPGLEPSSEPATLPHSLPDLGEVSVSCQELLEGSPSDCLPPEGSATSQSTPFQVRCLLKRSFLFSGTIFLGGSDLVLPVLTTSHFSSSEWTFYFL